MKDTLAQTVPVYVHLTASLASVDTQTDRVLPVLKDGWVTIVPQVHFTHNLLFLISHLAQLGHNWLIKSIFKDHNKESFYQTIVNYQ